MKKSIASIAALAFAINAPAFASLTDGLVAYWSFNATNAVDDSGNGHNGTINGSPTPVAGQFGNAYHFNGSSDWIIGAHSGAFDLTNSLTIGAWINYDSINSGLGAEILYYGDPTPGHDPWSLKLLQGGIAEFRVDAFGGGNSLTVTTNGLVSGQWYFLAGAESTVGDLRTLKLYLNGALAASVVTNAPISYNLSNMQPNIAAVDNGNLELFAGIIDEPFVYNRALSDAEIQQIAASSIPEPNTIGLALCGLASLGLALRRRVTS